MNDTDPDDPGAGGGATSCFGGGTLSSRLGNRVRQKEGLSYGVRSQYGADSLDKSARYPDVRDLQSEEHRQGGGLGAG